jgi:hypothetical protein
MAQASEIVSLRNTNRSLRQAQSEGQAKSAARIKELENELANDYGFGGTSRSQMKTRIMDLRAELKVKVDRLTEVCAERDSLKGKLGTPTMETATGRWPAYVFDFSNLERQVFQHHWEILRDCFKPKPKPLGLNWDYLKSPQPEYPIRWRNASPFGSRW